MNTTMIFFFLIWWRWRRGLLVANAKIPLRLERLDESEQEMFIANELLELHHGRIVIRSWSSKAALHKKK